MIHCRSSLLPGNIHGASAGGIVKPGGGNIGTGVGFCARALGDDRSKAPVIAAQTLALYDAILRETILGETGGGR